MKSYKVTKSFITLYALVGIWILIGSTIFSLFIANSPFWGFLTLALLLIIIYLLVSGRAMKKTDYTGLELTQRGIVFFVMIAVPGVAAVYWVGASIS